MLAPEWAEELRAELGWLGDALGPVRDLDVLIAHLLEEAEVLGSPERESLQALFERLEAERDRARTQLLAALRSERYFALLDRLEAAAEALPLTDADVSLGEIWHAEFVRLRKAVNRLEAEPADEALHEVRIRVKRARYATELAEPVLGSHAGELISAAKRLQDGLGAHQDAVVAEERIRDLLRGSRATSAHFAAGRLVERERARREEARAGFQKAWKRLDRLGRRTAKAR